MDLELTILVFGENSKQNMGCCRTQTKTQLNKTLFLIGRLLLNKKKLFHPTDPFNNRKNKTCNTTIANEAMTDFSKPTATQIFGFPESGMGESLPLPLSFSIESNKGIHHLTNE